MSERWLGAEAYVAALQCERRLWRALRDASRAEGAPLADSAAAQPGAPGAADFAPGGPLGRWLEARAEIPGALDALAPDAARLPAGLGLEAELAHSRALLADPAVPALRGALLGGGGWAVRADLVRRAGPRGLALCVLVADTAVREVDLDRAALLAHLLRPAGPLAAVELWCLARDYAGPAPAVDWARLVERRDATRDVRLLASDVPAQLERARRLGAAAQEPELEPSPHCWRPLRCEHWVSCTAALPAGPLVHLPRLRPEVFHELRARGVERIAEIPDPALLDASQALTRRAWLAGRAALAPELGPWLRALGPELAFLDFEAALPAVPLLAGMHPFEPIPVQWSLLRCAADGSARSADFLAPPGADPREAFAQSLCAALRDWSGPIAVYSDFEARALERLEARVPACAPELARLRGQLVDLLPAVRGGVAHPAFAGSYSLKRVAPALCPKIRYDDLAGVADGAQAARCLHEWVTGAIGARAESTAAALRVYCRRDVEALAALHAALLALSAAEDRV